VVLKKKKRTHNVCQCRQSQSGSQEIQTTSSDKSRSKQALACCDAVGRWWLALQSVRQITLKREEICRAPGSGYL
jgi:hypothetical protein